MPIEASRIFSRLNLAGRFVVGASLLLTVTLGAVTALTARRERGMLTTQLEARAGTIAALVGQLCVDPLLYRDVLRLDAIVSEVAQQQDVTYAMVKDAGGEWVTTILGGVAERERARAEGEGDVAKAMKALAAEPGWLHVSVPISQGDVRLGSIDLAMSRDALEREVGASVRQMALGIGVTLVLLGLTLFALSRYLITRPLARAVAVAGQLAEGDLTATVSAPSQDESGQMLGAMKRLIENLRHMIGQIKTTAQALAGAGTQISASSRQALQGAESQAAAARQTTASTLELQEAMRSMSDRASEIKETMERTMQGSEDTRRQLGETAAALDGIKSEMQAIVEAVSSQAAKTQQIQEIIGSVAELADQTQVVAINAGIEAANAGEAGRGFGVVAAELRALADQSKALARRVGSIVTEVRVAAGDTATKASGGRSRVEDGIRRISEMVHGTGEFAAGVDRSHQGLAAILGSVNQQAEGLRQISDAVQTTQHSVEEGLRQNQQLDEASKVLASLGKELQQLVQKYRFE